VAALPSRSASTTSNTYNTSQNGAPSHRSLSTALFWSCRRNSDNHQDLAITPNVLVHLVLSADYYTRNAIDITVLPGTTISGGCKTTAVVTVTGLNSLDALTSLRDLPCPTGGSGGSTEALTAVVTTATAPTTQRTTKGVSISASTPRPNTALGVYGAMNWAVRTGVVLGALAAVHFTAW